MSLKSLTFLALLLPAFLLCRAQESNAPTVPSVFLRVFSTTEVPGIGEPFLTNSQCTTDNKAFVTRMVGPTGEGDVHLISTDGKKVIKIALDRIQDVNHPSLQAFFASGSDIYLLLTGLTPQNKTVTLIHPNGEKEAQQAFVPGNYISHFRSDGSYVRTVALDLPFSPMQLGAFPSGDFLIAGAAKQTDEPRIALVRSTGQLNRFIELKGDIHARADSESATQDSLALPRKADNFDETLQAAEGLSSIIPDGRNLLLLRPGQKAPVFSISPGGQVTPIAVEAPKEFKLFDLKSGHDQWIAIYSRKLSDDPHDPRVESQTYALNPSTGKLAVRYIFPENLGFALACADGRDFTVLIRQDDKLQLINLMPIR